MGTGNATYTATYQTVFTAIRVNAGGPNYTDPSGNIWAADTGTSDGVSFSTGSDIANTTTPALYQSERWNGGTFQYQFNVPNGSYRVNLKFAEIYNTAAGQRVFNVNINGQPVLTNFDIFALAGANTALDRASTVNVTGGAITIEFVPIVSNPKISAIEILPASGVSIAVSPGSATLGQSQTQQFSATVTGSSNTSVTWSVAPAGLGTVSSSGLYTAPASITSSQSVTVKAVSNADTVTSGTATITLTPPVGSFTPIRVNAGGPAYTDSLGQTWSADTGTAGGSTYTTGANITGTSDPVLYQSEHWNGGTLQYQFNVPSGSYAVKLKFAEIYNTAAGERVFNVNINGAAVQSNFDIFATAGGMNIAVDRTFTVSSSGTITIQLIPVVSNPKISAIEIVPSSGINVSVTPAAVTLVAAQTQQFSASVSGASNTAVTWSISPAAGSISSSGLYTAPSSISSGQTVTVTATSSADGSTRGTGTITLSPPASATPIRVNAGGGTFVDSSGLTWSADTGFSAGNTFAVGLTITGTSSPALYQTERWNGAPFTYQFNLPAGTYTVTLKFAEIYFTASGQRVFNVNINGQSVLSNFDIFAQAGANIALDEPFTINHPGGQLTIQLVPIVNNPKISAIEIK